MTILKGAAATALYGSRAANGVILITTKTGKKAQRGLGIEYNGGMQWETLLRLPQMQNDFGMGWYGNKTDLENGSWGPRFDGSWLRYGNVYEGTQNFKSYVPIKNNVRDFFDTGYRYSNSVSLNGATDVSNFFLSLSQISQDGIIPTNADSYNKYTFSARASHKVNNLTFSTSLNYAYQRNNFVSTGQKSSSMYNNVMQTPRDISIVELKDLNNPFNTPGYYYTPYGVTNPYYVLNNFKNEFESERFYGKLQLDYDFLKYFKLTYRFGLDTSTEHHDMGEPNMSGLFKALRVMVVSTFFIEAASAGVLFFGFSRTMGMSAGTLGFAAFHAVSAFCNAGFALFSNNLESFTGDPIISLTISMTIILGGIGFAVISDVARKIKIGTGNLFTKKKGRKKRAIWKRFSPSTPSG